MVFKSKTSSLKLHKFFLVGILFLLFSNTSFAEEVVLNLNSMIYHKINGQHSLHCSDCVVAEKNKAEKLFEAKPCKVCFSNKKTHKKHKKGHKRSHKSKKKKMKHRKSKKNKHKVKRQKQI